jgi:hypothetical protein
MNLADFSKKLRLDGAKKILIINAPESYYSVMAELTFDTIPKPDTIGKYDFVQVFSENQAEMEKLIVQVGQAGKYDCIFWACYPKGGGKIKSNMKRETVWEALGLISLRPVSQVAIDETWSALRGRPHEVVGK